MNGAQATVDTVQQVDGVMSNGESILIVDDDQGTRTTLALILKRNGYRVEVAGTGREALEKAQGGTFDAALLDIRLPDMEGIELLAPLKERHPDIVVIMATAHASLKTAVQALNDGASAYVTKPLDMDELLSKMRDTLEKRRLVTENRRLVEAVQKELAERVQAEEETVKIQAQLLHSQKMDAVGRLAGGVAHDFNNVLTAILGYASFLADSFDARDPRREDVEQIRKAGERAAALTRQLLLFSRRQIPQTKALDLNTLIADMEKMLRRLIEEDLEWVVDLEPGLPRIEGDPGQIEQVTMNLVVNARDAMPDGGTLAIRTEHVVLDSDRCELSTQRRPGSFVCLSVTDTGIGMDKETMERIFEPFFTTKESGAGLGLAVVYGIVKQHTGWIDVHSEPGRGSVFRVYLPTCPAGAEDELEEDTPLEVLRGHGERILLVEDEEGVRTFTAEALAKSGYVVYEAATAGAALELFGKEQGKFALSFCDVVLPDGNGLQLVDRLRAWNPELRVLLASGYTGERSQWPVIRERGLHFLPKPYSLTDMLRAISRVLSGGRAH